jgi:hypothetical protein
LIFGGRDVPVTTAEFRFGVNDHHASRTQEGQHAYHPGSSFPARPAPIVRWRR